MLGVPRADGDVFRGFIHRIIEKPGEHTGTIEHEDTLDYYLEQVDGEDATADRRTTSSATSSGPRSTASRSPPEHIGGTIALLIIAGIDTTWSAIGASLWHLAQHPEDRQRLVEDPDVLPFAIEEFLRFYAPVTMARIAADDTEVGGCPVAARDWVLLPFPAANRDPEAFERADEFIIDRQRNRHVAFGLGIHRCAGSNLARMELTVAVDEWMQRIPDFELADPDHRSAGPPARSVAPANFPSASFAPRPGGLMRITFDREKCQGHGRCYSLAADLFDADDEGYAVVLVHGDLTEEQVAAAQLAADNCPEYAISVEA